MFIIIFFCFAGGGEGVDSGGGAFETVCQSLSGRRPEISRERREKNRKNPHLCKNSL